MTKGEPAILAEGLKKKFGTLVALDGISFHVEPGEIFGLLGPNGAGKTTAISILAGLLYPDTGKAVLASFPAGNRNARQRIGLAPQSLALYEDLSAWANLRFFGALFGLKGRRLRERAEEVLDRVGLRDRAGGRVETYSGGMKRRLNLAIALIHDPHVLLLDEPTVGVDPQSRAHIFDMIHDMARGGKAILYTTHYMEEAERLCKRIAIMDHGKILETGTLEELLSKLDHSHLHRFRVPAESADRAKEVLGEGAVRREAEPEESEVTFEVPGESRELGGQLSALDGAGVSVVSVEIEQPNLEALFLQRTGRRLRD
ncbi:MAG: ABC transporter ATP-binding protein [Planctomycetota bacterium]|jgi:ABC-2 type transport system ATP-binding protein